MTSQCFSIVVVFSLLCQQAFVQSALEECSGEAEYSILGMMLRRHIFKTITGAPLGDVCLRECHRDVRCQSFNYVISQNTCELNNRTKEARSEDFVPNSDRYYFKRDKDRGKWIPAMKTLVYGSLLFTYYCCILIMGWYGFLKRPSHGKLKLANSCWQTQVGVCQRHKNSRQTRFYLTPTVCKRVVCRLFLCLSHTPTWVCQHEFANVSLPCEGRFTE